MPEDSELKFDNPWMKKDGDFIVSDEHRFRIGYICQGHDEMNEFLGSTEEFGLICEDQHGSLYAARHKSEAD